MSEPTTPAILAVEEQINQELVKANVTEAVIATLKEKYMPLQIKGIDDKETYLIVKDARKECKSIRVMAKKICTKGREEANEISKAWVAKEKDVVGRIGEVEDHLEKQEKEFEANVAAEKERRRRQQEEQLINRQQILSNLNVLYSDGSFRLGEVSFELSLVKECDPEIWEADILPKFQAEYQKVEAERIEAEQRKLAQEAELKRQQAELELRNRELQEREAQLKAVQEEQERKQREEEEKKAAAEKAESEAKQKVRRGQLNALGLLDLGNNCFQGYSCTVLHDEILIYDEEQWSLTIADIAAIVADVKEKEEQKRQAEIAEQSRIAAEKAAKAERERIEKEQAAAELKRQQDEQKKAEEMAQAGDKDKWNDILSQLNGLDIHEMRSGQYRKKAAILREKLDEIKAL